MLDNIITLLLGLLGGISVGVQSPIIGGMSRRIGSAAGSFIVHVSGAVLSGVIVVLRGGENIREWNTLSWYMLVSGFFGVIVVMTLSHTLPRIGTAAAATLIIVWQLVIGVIIDHFGWI